MSVLTDETIKAYLGYSPKLRGVEDEAVVAGSPHPGGVSQTAPGFADLLQNALQQANDLQQKADYAARAVAAGDPAGPNLAQAVQVTEEAALAVSLTVAVRNRALEAYQEIMRMQV
ncbi:MAG: flagellar hook-basal body complex protein FliE [Bacteroidota bacterium]